MDAKVTVFVGGIIRDLITYARKFPRPGETIFGQDFQMGFGGKTANQVRIKEITISVITILISLNCNFRP